MSDLDTGPLAHALRQQWNVAFPAGEPVSAESLYDALERRVLSMLRHDFEKLQTALYLLDVPESKSAEALRAGNDQETARRLARIILERERERLRTRAMYEQSKRTPISGDP